MNFFYGGVVAQICQSCQRRAAAIHCFTENASFCLSSDYFLHSHANIETHIRNQLCDNCLNNSATIGCSIHRTILCQPCYSLRYNCATYRHQTQIFNHLHPQLHNNNNQQQQQHQDDEHVHAPQEQHNNNHHQHYQQVNVPQVQQHNYYVGGQRREGMFEMSCNGNNNCERWMFAMNCEACLASNAVVYCSEDDQLLCNNCDQMFHNHEVVPLHKRSVLCVTCKRLSRNFLIGGHQFNLPPTPAAPDEVSTSATTGPNLQNNNLP